MLNDPLKFIKSGPARHNTMFSTTIVPLMCVVSLALSPDHYKLIFIVLSIMAMKLTESERSTGEQRREVAGVHDEARVQVQVIYGDTKNSISGIFFFYIVNKFHENTKINNGLVCLSILSDFRTLSVALCSKPVKLNAKCHKHKSVKVLSRPVPDIKLRQLDFLKFLKTFRLSANRLVRSLQR